MAAMTPTGTPTSQTFCAGSSRRMPTVRWSRMASQTRWAAKRFLISLSWGVPRFLPGHAAQLAGTGQKGLTDRLDNGIQLFLGEGAKDLLRFLRLLSQLPGFLPGSQILIHGDSSLMMLIPVTCFPASRGAIPGKSPSRAPSEAGGAVRAERSRPFPTRGERADAHIGLYSQRSCIP